jgi:Protein of unknown function (DUF429)
MIGFGLDLSGYSTGRTVLAAVEMHDDTATAVILRNSALSKCRHGADDARLALAEEIDAFSKCISMGSIAVDVPIDLQGLPAPEGYIFIWELTKRPVDYAFGAMSPLADRLGACVARFKALLAAGNLESELGRRLFETYPAASLKLLGQAHRRYKGIAGRDLCNEIGAQLGFHDCDLLDDELDAIICAVTAAAPASCRLEGKRLLNRMHEVDPFTAMTPLGQREPGGFVLLEKWPCRRLTVSEQNFDTWTNISCQ